MGRVDPDVRRRGDQMDIRSYVKFKVRIYILLVFSLSFLSVSVVGMRRAWCNNSICVVEARAPLILYINT